jgi:hypothetical protein
MFLEAFGMVLGGGWVLSEPLSESNSLLTGKNTGKIEDFASKVCLQISLWQ